MKKILIVVAAIASLGAASISSVQAQDACGFSVQEAEQDMASMTQSAFCAKYGGSLGCLQGAMNNMCEWKCYGLSGIYQKCAWVQPGTDNQVSGCDTLQAGIQRIQSWCQ